ncbi:MAG: aminopeptidase P family protein [Caldilineaceae bacterium]|nr:aminopeptidase P family protein [Caldilineaceae bacterium]
MINYVTRLARVQAQMAEHNIDLLFLSRSANLHYVTGIPREEPNFGNTIYPGEWLTGAWIPQQGTPILTLPRMLASFHMGAVEGYDVRVLPDAGDPAEMVRDLLQALAVDTTPRIAVEDRSWSELLLHVQRLRPEAIISLASQLLMPLRVIKDEEEIAIMRKAGEITEAAYRATLPNLRHGMTNLDLISEVQYQLKKHGAQTDSFVTSFYNMGPHYPFAFHNREEMLLVPLEPPVAISYDMGGVYEGYCYDFGRSIYFGEPDAEYRKVYAFVMGAQAAGIAALAVGNTCEQADAAARQIIEDGGYGEAFMHRLGHAIGMDVHETPFLTAGDKTPLRPGMCFTVEPSIFIPHKLGCRVEDVVVVRENGGEPLTNRLKELHVVTS